MSVRADLDARIAAVEQAGLTPVTIILSYEDHWRLSHHDLGGPDVGYPRVGTYDMFAQHYRDLPIICPGLGHHEPPIIGVRVVPKPSPKPLADHFYVPSKEPRNPNLTGASVVQLCGQCKRPAWDHPRRPRQEHPYVEGTKQDPDYDHIDWPTLLCTTCERPRWEHPMDRGE